MFYLLSLLIVISVTIFAEVFQNKEKIVIHPVRIFDEYNFSSIAKVVKYKNEYYILESKNHRILVFNDLMKFERQISHIGQGKGELYYPIDFVIRGDYIYVLDNMMKRVQIFSSNGKYINGFSSDYKSCGIAVNQKGEIYLGQPQRGKLISVYSQNGKFLRSFGNLKKLSNFYGTRLRSLDKKYKIAINRVNICIDNKDNLYLSFLGAPFFQKYNKKGELLFEKRIQSPIAKKIIKEFRIKRKSPVRRGIDNVPTPLITTGIAVDSKSDYLVISFQWHRGWIYIANTDGEKISLLEIANKKILFENIYLSKDYTLFCPRLSVVKYNEVYAINLKKILMKGGD